MGFAEETAPYEGQTQKARFWSEGWVSRELYCLNCGAPKLTKLPNNSPVGDFACKACSEEYEVKSQGSAIGKRVVDGAYKSMMERLAANNNPSLVLLSYDKIRKSVTNLSVVPKHFFVPDIIQERAPLAPSASRAGWVGCNILLSKVPEAGRIVVVRDGELVPKDQVLELWQQTRFLRGERPAARGWLIEVMKCVESIGRAEFEIADVYRFEDDLRRVYPGNMHVREKMRQQLQLLRDAGFIEFLGRGKYRRRLNT
ncbi:MAG: restriction endonuclease [Proteobacteria bacterium]|nr:restriction endonuclease [Pseudomonadota bacterium]